MKRSRDVVTLCSHTERCGCPARAPRLRAGIALRIFCGLHDDALYGALRTAVQVSEWTSTTYNLLPTTYCLLLTTYYLLQVSEWTAYYLHYLLLTTYFLLLITYYRFQSGLPTTYYLLLTPYYLLLTTGFRVDFGAALAAMQDGVPAELEAIKYRVSSIERPAEGASYLLLTTYYLLLTIGYRA